MQPDIIEFEDSNKNTFYSINILVGLPDEPAVIEGGNIYSYNVLNDYIKEKSKK